MRTRDPKKRASNFREVALGLSSREALREAKRCLQCKKPRCVHGCPVEIDIPAFIALLRNRNFPSALRTIRKYNMLPAICGRVCPQETQCQGACILNKKGKPISIGALERFTADYEAKMGIMADTEQKPSNGHRVAVVGSGPAGLTVAADLARIGYSAVLLEALHEPGGVLAYGIPEFRLPKKIIAQEIDFLKRLGVEIRLNWVVGRTQTVQELFDEGFKAVFIGVGAGTPKFMGIPGENLNNVYFASEYLTRVNLMKADTFPRYDTPVKRARKVAVIGGGNVAMDAARTALRLGASRVYIVYRRTRNEMPSRLEEIEHAEEEGIQFRFLTNPKEILSDKRGYVRAMVCDVMKLGDPDSSGRRKPVRSGKEKKIILDQVIVAIGQTSNPILVTSVKGLALWGDGYITTDEDGRTNIPGVFAGGDITTGSATVISAMGAGKRAARAMHEYILASTEQKSAASRQPGKKRRSVKT